MIRNVGRARYDQIADFYDGVVGDRVDDNAGTAALLDLVGEVRGARVLDLACGQGRMARALAARGASVVGVDISGALLDKARAVGDAHALSIVYRLVDAAAPNALSGQTFDLVVCNFGLTDIDDLDGALATVARVLPSRGAFVFSILHPCFPGWGESAPSSWPPDSTYFDEGWWLARNRGFRGMVGSNHRTLSTYLNLLARHKLRIEHAVEPEPTEWAGTPPSVPLYFVGRCCREG